MSQNPRSSFSPALIKPTYNVGDYGHDVIIPLNCLSGSTVTLVPSTSTFVQVLEDGRVPVDEVNQFITNSDEMAGVHTGDDTDYNTSWEWLPDMSFQAYTDIWDTVPLLGRYIFNSVFLATVTTFLCMSFVIPAAYSFARFKFRG